MLKYILRRLVLLIPTLLGITIVVFGVVNLAPGSPIEQKIQQLRFAGSADAEAAGSQQGTATVSKEVLDALKKQYGFDKPVHVRYWIWLKNLAKLDFGDSFTYEEPVIDVIMSKFPVSLQFGVMSLLLSYLISIPLGVWKAVKHGSRLDGVTSFILFIAYSIPSFMLAIVLIVFFAGGSFLDIFPIGGLYSDFYDEMTAGERVLDRIYHFILPLICYTIGSYTQLTLLMKNSLMEEVKKDYIRTARAKGLGEKTVYLKHALRNALIPIVTGIGGFLSIFFAGSLILEKIFQLDGIGLLSFNSILSRDYNVIMGLVFIQALLMLIGNIISDVAYVLVDPRIDFQ
ncbi:MAG: peptide ABC transporter permease [Halobacteriovoraceae bacterium]|nr:peptide ABC transporter permease [Halobacteriovoraceae bacterium]|tara:strand:- start:148322 stop:149350 length:1029 start_codon:yes stop_codon:yes gene_type:complete